MFNVKHPAWISCGQESQAWKCKNCKKKSYTIKGKFEEIVPSFQERSLAAGKQQAQLRIAFLHRQFIYVIYMNIYLFVYLHA